MDDREGQKMKMPSCKDITMEKAKGEAPKGLYNRFMHGLHLMLCKNCRRYEHALDSISENIEKCLKKKIPKDVDTKDLEKSIIDKIK